jgi:HAD superfamily hydrolase (TIGR01509 family)
LFRPGGIVNYDCIIFDMDGTLTEDRLDFAAIRRDLAIPLGIGILEAMAEMDPARRTQAERKLLAHEMKAAAEASLADGAQEVLSRIRRAGLAMALLTRNARPAMETVLRRFDLSFDLTMAREDGAIKPSPDSVLAACRTLGADPGRTACVGDYLYDIQAANAAGCLSVLLARGRQLDYADQADCVIQSLRELVSLLGLEEE